MENVVRELSRQAEQLGYPYEILLLDDYSYLYQEENRQLSSLYPNVIFEESSENIGRSKIRNLLVSKVKYDYVIMIDCDSKIKNPDYIKRYIDEIPSQVVVGGTCYEEQVPEKKFMFRWKFGVEREQRTAAERNLNPNKSFTTFNFMIERNLFLKIRFDESLSGYGHEDTLFGFALTKQNIIIKHIDNANIHLGLEDTDTFLLKMNNSIRNVWKIYQTATDREMLISQINLLRYYLLLKRWHLTFLLRLSHKLFSKLIKKNLRSDSPSLLLFDIYKLGILENIIKA